MGFIKCSKSITLATFGATSGSRMVVEVPLDPPVAHAGHKVLLEPPMAHARSLS